jgi:hypothetical protein
MANRKNSAHIDRGADAANIDDYAHDTVPMALSLGVGKRKARFKVPRQGVERVCRRDLGCTDISKAHADPTSEETAGGRGVAKVTAWTWASP